MKYKDKVDKELIEIFNSGGTSEIINIPFETKVVEVDDTRRSVTFKLTDLCGDRWVEKEISGKKGLYDEVDRIFISYEVLKKSFEEAPNKGFRIRFREEWNEGVGARDIYGLQILLQKDEIEQAFLSCHGLFRRRLWVFAYLARYGPKYNQSDFEKVKKDFKNTGPLIDYVCKNMRSLSNLKDRLKGYNKDRNEIDHEMTEGRIDRRRIIDNIRCGISLLEELDNAFQKEFLSTTSG